MIDPMTAASLIQGGLGAVQTALGFGQKAKAAKLQKKLNALERPELKENEFIDESYNLTQAMAGQGLSESAKQAYISNNDRNLTASLGALLKTGGSPNLVSDLYDNSQSGIRNLALAEDDARRKNINTYLEYGIAPKASESRDMWMTNKMVPFQDKSAQLTQQIAGLSQDGMKNIFGGVNTMGSAAISAINPWGTGSSTGTGGGAPAPLAGGNFGTQTRISSARGAGPTRLATGPAGPRNWWDSEEIESIAAAPTLPYIPMRR
jgi:hypothetical protein